MRLLGALVAILALVLITMAALGSFGPTETARAVPTPPRAATPSAASASPTASGDRGITVTLTEDELTQAAQSYSPMTVSGITVTDPRIRLAAGRLTLTATGRAFFVSGPIVVVASPVVTNGTAGARIESATLAGFGEAPPPLIQETTALDLEKAAALLRERRISSTALTEACLARIAAVEPRVNAFVTVTADIARAQAAEAEREIAAGRYRGTLHGIPGAAKDLFATKGIRTP